MITIGWERDDSIPATEGAYFELNGAAFDLVVTELAAGGFEVDVLDEDVRWRGWRPTRHSARSAAAATAHRLALGANG